MIAKRVPNKQAKPRVARLVKYIVDAEGKLDPRSWERTADYILCSKTNKYGEKVGGVRVTNCHTDDPAAATTLIEATQAANTRSKTDKTYHLVFSFPPGEEPDLKTLHKIEDELVASIGYAEHQRISAVHIDTDHLHVHVAINKVHPTGYQNIEPYYDKRKLMETCERLEIEHGLIRTNHGLTGKRKREKENRKQVHISNERGTHNVVRPNEDGKMRLSPEDERESCKDSGTPSGNKRPARPKNKAADLEAHAGIESLQGFISRGLAPRLKEAKTWKEAQSLAAEHGLEIKLRGAGLVIGSGELWARASQCDRDISFKKMTDRLGPFEKAQAKVKKPFEPKPQQAHPATGYLYEQYQLDRQRALALRNYELDRIKYEGAVANVQVQKWHIAQRLLIKATAPKGPKRRAMLKVVGIQTKARREQNQKAVDARRRQVMSVMPIPSWVGWLTEHAEAGNADALSVLRSKQERESMNGNFFTAPIINDKSNIVITTLNPLADKDGSVYYNTVDRGIVVDRKTHVQCMRTTAGSAQLALELATRRFTGQALIVEGQESFQKEVARLAGLRGVDVRFASPEIEKERKAAIPKREKSKEIEL